MTNRDLSSGVWMAHWNLLPPSKSVHYITITIKSGGTFSPPITPRSMAVFSLARVLDHITGACNPVRPCWKKYQYVWIILQYKKCSVIWLIPRQNYIYREGCRSNAIDRNCRFAFRPWPVALYSLLFIHVFSTLIIMISLCTLVRSVNHGYRDPKTT